MSDANWEILRERFIVKYDTFRERLRKRLGSDDLAREPLQETWLQLARSSDIWSVLQPNSYLFGIALNMAAGLGTQQSIGSSNERADRAAPPWSRYSDAGKYLLSFHLREGKT